MLVQAALIYQAGPSYSGRPADVRATVYDNSRRVLVNNSNIPDGSTAFVESGLVPGSYYAPFTADVSQFPLMVDYLIDGTTHGSSDIVRDTTNPNQDTKAQRRYDSNGYLL